MLNKAHYIKTTSSLDVCKNYKELNQGNRSWRYVSTKAVRDDSKLITGWYRISGSAGDIIKVGYSKINVTRGYVCGSRFSGFMTSSPPAETDGITKRWVCFFYYNCFYKNRSFKQCSCSRMMEILVRNCGKYFVYWLPSTPSTYGYMTDRQAPTEKGEKDYSWYPTIFHFTKSIFLPK